MNLEELAIAMAAPKANSAAVERAIGGHETERTDESTRRYELEGGQQFDNAVLALDRDGATFTPRSVRLKSREGSALDIKELSRRFGQWRRVPAEPHREHEIVFTKDGPGDHRVAIYAGLSADAKSPDATVRKLMLVRESKP